jgi:hypothetical protein
VVGGATPLFLSAAFILESVHWNRAVVIPQPISMIHLVPAMLLYGVTIAFVDIDKIFELEGQQAPSGVLIYTLQLCAVVLVFFLARLMLYIPPQHLATYIPQALSFLRRPFANFWLYFVFVVRIWMLAGFEAGSLLMIVVQLSAGEIDPKPPLVAGGVILSAALHVLYEQMTNGRRSFCAVSSEERTR